jgi:pimeloyl-ACP methyl ester carboxylesterase
MSLSDSSIRQFHLRLPQSDLDDLTRRLAETRWPSDPPTSGWAYGVPSDVMRELVDYWAHGYDWRTAEAALNVWPQYTTTIDGSEVHFAHISSPHPDATPLIMTHGWPGSLVEFSAVAAALTDPASVGGDPHDAFHLVLPSVPGFTLSGPTTSPGWDHIRVAHAWAELMRRLGYEQYGAQGGDWGGAISRELGRIDSTHVIGVHLNLLPGSGATREPEPSELNALPEPERERLQASWARAQAWDAEQSGYAELQATRPQTLAYALTDSPVGQLAWIAEKFHEWSEPGIDIDRDHLLTNVTLYWATRTAGSAARIYYERAHAPYQGTTPEPSTTPTALAVFAHENFIPLRHLAERYDHIVRWTEFDHGGHFAALEQPTALVGDIRAFFRDLRSQAAAE